MPPPFSTICSFPLLQVFQARLHDLLWLELQAWRYGHSMKSLDEALIQSRETRVPDILSDILDFEYVPCPALSQGKKNVCRELNSYGKSHSRWLLEIHLDRSTFANPSKYTIRSTARENSGRFGSVCRIFRLSLSKLFLLFVRRRG